LKAIVSSQNPTFRFVRGLKQKKQRVDSGCYLIEGPHLVEEALAAGAAIRLAVLAAGAPSAEEDDQTGPAEIIAGLVHRLADRGVETVQVDSGLFQKLSDTVHPQGIMAVVESPPVGPEQFFTASNDRRHLLVLDRIQDPGNLGTLLRTADAAGFRGAVALRGTADIYSPKTVRSAAGALFRLPVWQTEKLSDLLKMLAERQLQLVAGLPLAETIYNDFHPTGEVALVIGNEAGGVAADIAAQALGLRIPMQPGAESLNAAVAAGILMFWLRSSYGKVS